MICDKFSYTSYKKYYFTFTIYFINVQNKNFKININIKYSKQGQNS